MHSTSISQSKTNNYMTQSLLDSPKKANNSKSPSQKPLRKVVNQLQSQLQVQRQQKKTLRQQLQVLTKKSKKRQQEFNHIIFTALSNRAASTSQQAHTLFQNIQEHFPVLDAKSQKLVEKQFKHIQLRMDRRIQEIVNVCKQEIEKHKVISKESQEIIRDEVNNTAKLALKIEEANTDLKMRIQKVEIKNKVLEEEKQLLVEECVYKKKCIAKLYAELQVMGKNVNMKMKNNQGMNNKNVNINLNSDTNKSNIDSSKDKLINDQDFPRFLGQPPLLNFQQKQQSQRYTFSNSLQKPINKSNQSLNSKINKIKNLHTYHRSSYSSNRTNSALQISRSDKKPQLSNNRQLQYSHREHKPNISHKSDREDRSQQQQIYHLRKCLARQKKKVTMLNAMLVQSETRNKQINEALIEIFSVCQKQVDLSLAKGKAKVRNKNSLYNKANANDIDNIIHTKDAQKILELLLKSKKLIDAIQNLRKRVTAVQSPVHGAGWDKIDISQEQIKELYEKSVNLL